MMKALMPLAALGLVVSGSASSAAALDQKSLAPAWLSASAADKSAWVTSYKYKRADTNPAEISICLDKYAEKPLFATNALTGVTQLCETINGLDK